MLEALCSVCALRYWYDRRPRGDEEVELPKEEIGSAGSRKCSGSSSAANRLTRFPFLIVPVLDLGQVSSWEAVHVRLSRIGLEMPNMGAGPRRFPERRLADLMS